VFILGNACLSLVHFLIEDRLGAAPKAAFFFLTDYSACISVIWVISLILIVFFIVKERAIRKISLQDYNAKMTLPFCNAHCADIVLGMAVCSVAYSLICFVYQWLTLALDREAFFKIMTTIFAFALLIVYLVFEKQHFDGTKKKLYYSLIGAVLLGWNLLSILVLFEYANPSMLSRLTRDCGMHIAVEALGSQWRNSPEQDLEKFLSNLSNTSQNDVKKYDLSFALNDKDSLTIKFNVLSSLSDIYKSRGGLRLPGKKLCRCGNTFLFQKYATGPNMRRYEKHIKKGKEKNG
jgi:hypothetical protein